MEQENPIIDRIIPKYKDKNGNIHNVLIETITPCISGMNGERLDKTLEQWGGY